MDELVLRKIVAAVGDSATLAMLACSCRLLRRLAAEEQAERGHCPHLWRLLGHRVPCDSAAQARAAALLSGSFRRQLLLDLAEAQARGVAYDGRAHSYDLISLPDRGAFLEQVELVAADLQHMVFYSSGLRVLAALSFVDRPAGAPSSSGSRQPRLFSSILCSVLVRAPLRLGLLFLEPPLLVGAADYLLANQVDPVAREQLAALAEAALWRQRFGPDDDVHILWQSLVRYMPSFALAAGSLHGCLDSTFVRTVSDGLCSCTD
ncbi:1-deoxy-D-xylulose-5-phosphate reductoisomerase [Chlorella sorokiniana]|uniref:1-deoxy-D-xylulose-5-phosphate reductoisomerase n=1 Tax=Chlorella sorokiniana TaxID=3076 RepID=A0A2P6TDL7_CHLSO|nr:1-deoxy-D-xylulose-5-phosphate reductoisomerase [Chlorella sorokiniana]|eukprot:PRW20743.1 1-deoxy-D-xylulose-5-phosphate reductoisomerase [Chlorella sorokiniana]